MGAVRKKENQDELESDEDGKDGRRKSDTPKGGKAGGGLLGGLKDKLDFKKVLGLDNKDMELMSPKDIEKEKAQ